MGEQPAAANTRKPLPPRLLGSVEKPGGRDSIKGVFSPQTFTMAVANVCDGGCKRLRWRVQTFAGKEAVHCKDGCSALRGRLQCTAGTVAVHCGSGCSALRERLQCTASEMGKTGTEIASPILDKRTGRRDAPVVPLEISTEPIYLVILILFASGCKKTVKRAASLRKLPLYLRAHLMRTRLTPYAERIYSLTTTLSMPT